MNENADASIGGRFRLDPEVLRRLHSSTVEDQATVRQVLATIRDARIELIGKRTLRGDAETAQIREILESELLITASHVTRRRGESIFFNFALGGRSYFFSSVALELSENAEPTRISFPLVLYVAERRDRARLASNIDADGPRRVRISEQRVRWTADGHVEDYSPVGLNVQTGGRPAARTGDIVRVEYMDGSLAGEERWGQVRYAGDVSGPSGWLRLGLSVSQIRQGALIGIERRNAIAASRPLERARQALAIWSAGAAAISAKVVRRKPRGPDSNIRVVAYKNKRGEVIKGIVDSTGSPQGSIAVVIPPAWGRTKETLLPLALTIVETFRRAGRNVSVLRFDGTRRRGESHKEKGFEAPGSEHLKFTFSDAIDDIRTSARFLTGPEIGASGVILVTFSAASIEGRRAVVQDKGQDIRGWVSVVGTPDLQSGMRTVSGGVDYVAGVEKGIRFGVQEIMGVPTDVDLLMEDALSLQLPFLEDARRDMAQISIPITWIHGANDAWLDLERVRVIMSCGQQSNRKLIEVPTGHQLRSSREALEVFQLVASETGEMESGQRLVGAIPNLADLEERRRAERQRVPDPASDLKTFWKDYLIGRDGGLGIELMNATRAFEELMATQIDCLELHDGVRVADVGSGTGPFPLYLARHPNRPATLDIHEIDYVSDALDRARERLESVPHAGMHVNFFEADLNDAEALARIFPPSSYDAALLSLVLSYVRDAQSILHSIFRCLKPGGRIVLSSLKRDADVSRLYLQGVDELRQGRAREVLGSSAEGILDESVRRFLNDMARVLDLEELDVFRFLDPEEIEGLVAAAGFESSRSMLAFGDPPQAVVISARKPYG